MSENKETPAGVEPDEEQRELAHEIAPCFAGDRVDATDLKDAARLIAARDRERDAKLLAEKDAEIARATEIIQKIVNETDQLQGGFCDVKIAGLSWALDHVKNTVKLCFSDRDRLDAELDKAGAPKWISEPEKFAYRDDQRVEWLGKILAVSRDAVKVEKQLREWAEAERDSLAADLARLAEAIDDDGSFREKYTGGELIDTLIGAMSDYHHADKMLERVEEKDAEITRLKAELAALKSGAGKLHPSPPRFGPSDKRPETWEEYASGWTPKQKREVYRALRNELEEPAPAPTLSALERHNIIFDSVQDEIKRLDSDYSLTGIARRAINATLTALTQKEKH